MRRAHELRLDDSVAKSVHASRHRRVILCALRSEEELPIDDTREMDEDGFLLFWEVLYVSSSSSA
jgi:hypothetical protein